MTVVILGSLFYINSKKTAPDNKIGGYFCEKAYGR